MNKIYIKKRNSMLANNPSQLIINLFWYSLAIVDIFRKLLSTNLVISVLRNGLYILVFAYVLYDACAKKQLLRLLVFAMTFEILFGISMLVYPDLSVLYFENSLVFLSRCLPGYYLARNIVNWKNVLQGIAKWHWIGLFYSILVFISTNNSLDNYMSFSYALLVPAFITVTEGFYEHNLLYIVSGVIMTIALFIFGARGPLLCIIIALIIIVYESCYKKISYRNLILLVGLVAVVFIFTASFNSIFMILYNRFPQARNLLFLKSGSFNNLTGREDIFNKIIDEILKNPVLPKGLMADRILLSKFTVEKNVYPHNFFLEIIYQFGIFGIIFLCWFLYELFRILHLSIYKGDRILTIVFAIFVVMAVTKAMYTGSYVSDMQIWFAFGCLESIRKILLYCKCET